VLIPVWHGVSATDVAAFSPTLAQRFALIASEMHIDELALRLLDGIRPDLAEGPRRRAELDRILSENTTTSYVARDRIRRPEHPVHEVLPADHLRRIRLIQGALYEVFPVSFDETVENFKRDLRPDREIEIWESIAGTYFMIINDQDVASLQQRKEIFQLVLAGYSGYDLERIETHHIAPELAAGIRLAFAS
jgi:hypothetical protein